MKVKHCLSTGIPLLIFFFLILSFSACDDPELETVTIDDEIVPVEPGPSCDNCKPVSDVLYECFHWASDTNGTACSKYYCIKNVLKSASCTKYDNRREDPDCDTKTVNGPEIVQTVHSSNCPGGAVNWQLWKTLWYGCGKDCKKTEWYKSCETNACSGVVVLGPSNRGQKKACGC